MTMASLVVGAVRRPRASGTRWMTWRDVLLLSAGALISPLFFAMAATAGPSRTVPHGIAFVINEVPDNAMGQRHRGSVIWRINRIQAAGQPDELVIHADIKIPEVKMTMTMDIRRNTDKSLPASHVVEMTFGTPREAGRQVISSPGIMMKFAENARGTPLSAVSVKVIEGSFLIGLSNRESDRARNLQILKERRWFDIPMVYANQHRGILAVEKGFHGEDVFNEAMTAWEQPR
jgi:hypothetical protein